MAHRLHPRGPDGQSSGHVQTGTFDYLVVVLQHHDLQHHHVTASASLLINVYNIILMVPSRMVSKIISETFAQPCLPRTHQAGQICRTWEGRLLMSRS